MQSQRHLQTHLEQNKEQMQQHVAELENESTHLEKRMLEYKRDADLASRQLDYEHQRFRELEDVITRERRTMQTDSSNLRRLQVETQEQ